MRLLKKLSQKQTLPIDSNPYEMAKDWVYERYQIQEVMASRWQLAFWLQLFFSAGLIILLFALLPLKTWEPIIIHRNNQSGEV
jgi:type IV secretory pathway component VirB8